METPRGKCQPCRILCGLEAAFAACRVGGGSKVVLAVSSAWRWTTQSTGRFLHEKGSSKLNLQYPQTCLTPPPKYQGLLPTLINDSRFYSSLLPTLPYLIFPLCTCGSTSLQATFSNFQLGSPEELFEQNLYQKQGPT